MKFKFRLCGVLVVTLALLATQYTLTLANGPLRQHAQARNFFIGAAVAMDPFNNEATYKTVLGREFNMLVAENAMKFEEFQRFQRGQFRWDQADALVDFASQNGMKVRGHALIWHRQVPDWLKFGTWTRTQLLEIMREHILAVVGRYKDRRPGVVRDWDVVNEAFNDNDGTLRSSVWRNVIGDDYIDWAFRYAREADPNAKLFYNDFGAEERNSKSDAVYNLVSSMKSRGVPIDGVGMQFHISGNTNMNFLSVWSNMKRLNDLGLEVQVTELDVTLPDNSAASLEKQAQVYGSVLNTCLDIQRCTALLTWGFTDKYTWFGSGAHPLPYDINYNAKPAYWQLHNVLVYDVGTAYSGTPNLPGTVQAENYNRGGAGVAYRDKEVPNRGGALRTNEGVDIANCGGSCHIVGWVSAGEWIRYTVNVTQSGTYRLDFNIASNGGGGKFWVEMNGQNVTGSLTTPNTGGWNTYQIFSKSGVTLNAGTQVMRIVMEDSGPNSAIANFDWISFTRTGNANTRERLAPTFAP